ncbi:MAG: TIGR02147 family protein [Bdellovibrio sp.]
MLSEEKEISHPEISHYLDYRKYLAEFLSFKKEQTRKDLRPYGASHFAAAADFKSPHYLNLVISGQRNLSIKMTVKFCRALSLSKLEGDEFVLLVRYNQAHDPTQRSLFLRALNDLRVQKKIKSGEIKSSDWQRWPDWVGWVLYALADQKGVPTNPTEIVKLLRHQVSLDQLRRSLHHLIEQGLISVDAHTGLWVKSKNGVEVAEEVPVAVVRKLQSQLMELGLESLYRDPADEREFGSLTLSLTQSEFEELRFQLRKLRKSIHKENAIHRMENKGDRIYQLNLQLFPVSDPSK